MRRVNGNRRTHSCRKSIERCFVTLMVLLLLLVLLCTRRDGKKEENLFISKHEKKSLSFGNEIFSHTHNGDAEAIPAYFCVSRFGRGHMDSDFSTDFIQKLMVRVWFEEVHRRCILLSDLHRCDVCSQVLNLVKYSRMSHLIAKVTLFFSSSNSHWFPLWIRVDMH